MLEALSDFELIRKTTDGYIDAFSVLVKRYQKQLTILSMRYVSDISSAEDIVQESFMKAYEKLASFQFRSAFKSWIYRIVINTAKNKLRSKKNMIDINDVVIKIAAVSELTVIERQLAEQMKNLIEQLPYKQRRALELRSQRDSRPVHDLVDTFLRAALIKELEDLEDLKAFEGIENEPIMTLDELEARLKADGKI